MPVNTTHPAYDANLESWLRIRDVMKGDAAIKRGGEKYMPRLDSQSDREYQAYIGRGFFYNATARTVAGYLGLIYRKDPILEVLPMNPPLIRPSGTFSPSDGEKEEKKQLADGYHQSALQTALKVFVNDVDLVGTTLDNFSKKVVEEVISIGRAGTLVDWQGPSGLGTSGLGPSGLGPSGLANGRAYLTVYPAEAILNWRERRINGKLKLSLVVLQEMVEAEGEDLFEVETVQQIRVLRLVESSIRTTGGNGGNGESRNGMANGTWKMEENLGRGESKWEYRVEIWRLLPEGQSNKKEWQLVESLTPLRLGKALDSIPFVFHGPTHARPKVEKSPIEDIVAANLDHYRLNTDYKHGMHFTALPTAFVTGFDKGTELKIGSTTAWVTETVGATAQYLEFQGQGLMTFERALDRTERLLAALGSRLLESEKRMAESAEALAIREKGEESVIGGIARSVSGSLNEVLHWVYWWHSGIERPELVTAEEIYYMLNQNYEAEGLKAQDLQALVAAWQNGAISRETLLHNLKAGEVLPPGRSEQEEKQLIQAETGNYTPHSGDGRSQLVTTV